jgi:hypothetical protein
MNNIKEIIIPKINAAYLYAKALELNDKQPDIQKAYNDGFNDGAKRALSPKVIVEIINKYNELKSILPEIVSTDDKADMISEEIIFNYENR